jgi:hypothetical protein
MIYRNTPTIPPIRGRLTLALLGLFAFMTKRRRLHVAEHDGIFAGSLLHRGDCDYE